MKISELIALLRADLMRLSPIIAKDPEGQRPQWTKLLSPRFIPVLLVRLAHYFYHNRRLRFLSPVFTWLNVMLFGIEVTARCDIGPGLMLPHTTGTVIGATRIGEKATIFQGVTLGAKFADMVFDTSQRPTVGDEVVIGAGAKVLGGIHLGDKSTVAANSLVISSVPDGALAIGVPATIKQKI